MLTCPHCGQQAMTSSAKMWLGPARTRNCDACGKRVSVPWRSMLMLIPVYAGLGLGAWLWPSWTAALPVILGMLAMLAYHDRITPLVSRET